MGLLDEPTDPTYVACRDGFSSLLRTVDKHDQQGAAAKSGPYQNPCDAVLRYLDQAFLGQYYRSTRPFFLHNATNLFNYIDYLQETQEHRSILHETYLQLLAYLNFIETHDPLILIGNCLRFIETGDRGFDFDIFQARDSGRAKYNEVSTQVGGFQTSRPGVLGADFTQMVTALDPVFDRQLRNAIAHSSYTLRVRNQKVHTWDRSSWKSYGFNDVAALYNSAYYYLVGFASAVEDFAEQLVPDCQYAWHWGPRY